MKIRAFLVSLIVLAMGTTAAVLAHNGEYRPPNPPPLPKPGPPGAVTPRGGVPTWRRKIPTVPTPPNRPRSPGSVTPEPSSPDPTGRSLGRRDDRFRWDLWWEIDRRLFLGSRKTLEGAARHLALEALRSSLGDEDTIVRSRALVALARLGEARVPDMAAALIEKNEPGLHAATLSLGLARGAGAGKEESEPILVTLKAMINDEGRSIGSRTLAMASLGLSGVPAAKTVLREVVDEERRPNLRSAAILSLGLLRDTNSVARMRRLLVSRRGNGPGDLNPLDDLVRCAAAFALGRIGTDASRIALLNALEEGDGLAGGSAALALGSIGDPAARAALRETIGSDRPLPTRALAIVALARLADEGLGPILVKLVTSGEILRIEFGGVAILGLGVVGGESAAATLIGVLKNADVPVRNRAAAAAALGRLGARGAIAPLRELTPRARDPLFRGHLVLALARTGGEAADGFIQENLEHGKTDALRRLTMDSLGVREGAAAATRLVIAYADAYFVHREAVHALARFDPGRALTGALSRHEDEKNRLARRFAADALGWLLTPQAPEMDLVRGMNPLCGMPLIQAILFVGGEEYVYDMTLGL